MSSHGARAAGRQLPHPLFSFSSPFTGAALELHVGNSEKSPFADESRKETRTRRKFTIATNANWGTCPRSLTSVQPPAQFPWPLPLPQSHFPYSCTRAPLSSPLVMCFLRSVEAACRVSIVCVIFVFSFFVLHGILGVRRVYWTKFLKALGSGVIYKLEAPLKVLQQLKFKQYTKTARFQN